MALFDDGVMPPSVLPGLPFPAFPSPQAAQTIALLAQLDATQWWSPDALRERQRIALDALVRHAARTTPRGRALYADVPSPLTWEAFARIPILTREELQRAPESLRSERIPREHGPVAPSRSSGSTSSPVTVDRTALCGVVWHAFGVRDHLWHRRDGQGILAAIRHAPGAGPPAGSTTAGWGPAMAALGRTGPCHTLHVGATTREQVDWLRSVRPAWLLVYPSSLQDLLDASPSRPSDLRGVLTFGEVVEPALRDRLAAQWGVPLHDSYSAEEVGYLALQCPDADRPSLHVQSEAVHLEILRDDGSPCAAGEVGRVVVSVLHGFAMPLVRYALGDLAVPGGPCPCGRGLPVIERVIGRVHQTFVTASGDRIWLTIGVHVLPELGPVRQHQLVQTRPGALELRLVAHRPPTDAETDAIRRHVQGRLPDGTGLTVTWVDAIDRTPSGKFLSFVGLPTR